MTNQLVEAISRENWDDADSIQKERFTLLEAIIPALNESSEQSEAIEMLRKIQSMDADIISLLMAERDQIARQLLHLQNTSQADKAYRNCYEN